MCEWRPWQLTSVEGKLVTVTLRGSNTAITLNSTRQPQVPAVGCHGNKNLLLAAMATRHRPGSSVVKLFSDVGLQIFWKDGPV